MGKKFGHIIVILKQWWWLVKCCHFLTEMIHHYTINSIKKCNLNNFKNIFNISILLLYDKEMSSLSLNMYNLKRRYNNNTIYGLSALFQHKLCRFPLNFDLVKSYVMSETAFLLWWISCKILPQNVSWYDSLDKQGMNSYKFSVYVANLYSLYTA